MFIAVGLLGVLGLMLLYYVICGKIKYARFYKLLGEFDALPSYPIIGNAHLLLKGSNKKNLVEKFLEIMETRRKKPFVFHTGKLTLLVLQTLEDIQEVLSKLAHRDTLGFVEDTFLNGIIAQNYGQWRKTRRIMNPAFGPMMMKHYLNVFNEQARIFNEIMSQRADTGETTDFWPYLVNASIDMATENLSGVNMNVQKNHGGEFSRAVIDIMDLTVKRIFNPFLHPTIFFRLYIAVTGKKKIIDTVHRYTREAIVQAKRKYEMHQEELKYITVDDEKIGREPKNTVELLLSTHSSDPDMTEKQMQAELISILVAGSESSAIIFGFCLMMLAIYQDVQEKVYEEIERVMGDREVVTMDDVSQLNYIEQCIKETIRVYTVLPATPRCTLEEMKIGDNKTIPANCMLLLVLEAVHKDPLLYPNPGQWNVENFSPEAVARRPKNSFLGFSIGPRACLGTKYATISIKTQTVHLLRKFRIRTNAKYEDVETKVDIFKRSKNGYPLILETRK